MPAMHDILMVTLLLRVLDGRTSTFVYSGVVLHPEMAVQPLLKMGLNQFTVWNTGSWQLQFNSKSGLSILQFSLALQALFETIAFPP